MNVLSHLIRSQYTPLFRTIKHFPSIRSTFLLRSRYWWHIERNNVYIVNYSVKLLRPTVHIVTNRKLGTCFTTPSVRLSPGALPSWTLSIKLRLEGRVFRSMNFRLHFVQLIFIFIFLLPLADVCDWSFENEAFICKIRHSFTKSREEVRMTIINNFNYTPMSEKISFVKHKCSAEHFALQTKFFL